jgi:hypothetical protein
MFFIPTADDLVDYLKDFTGSTNTNEIKQCINMAEMSMRNVELPALRSDPYAPANIGVIDSTGQLEIPGDMNRPILFFRQGYQYSTSATCTGSSGATTIVTTTATINNQPIVNGMIVSGTGIATNATVTNVTGTSPTQTITLSIANTGTVSGTITFSTNAATSTPTGPWIIYDRIGDRDIIAQSMLAQLYLQPVNVPQIIRGKFSEVYNKYQFVPTLGVGALVNMYYYKAWPLLFSPVADTLVSTTGTVGSISGAGPWTATISNMTTNEGMDIGEEISAIDDTGSLGTGGVYTVTSLIGANGITYTATGGTTPVAGDVTTIKIINQTVQTNAVLNTWPEGYVYASLREYFIKRHNAADASIYAGKFDLAYDTVLDQNNLGKWSGGHTKLSSVWQPRQYRQYNIR